jgi:hypothetical protein
MKIPLKFPIERSGIHTIRSLFRAKKEYVMTDEKRVKKRHEHDVNVTGETYMRDFGHDCMGALAVEDDIDELTQFLQLFGFPETDSKTAAMAPFYVNPALPSRAYSETEVRSYLFNYSVPFFLLRKRSVVSALLSFRFPLPQYYSRAMMIELILNVSPENSDHHLLSEFFNFAFDCLPSLSLIECTKVKGFVLSTCSTTDDICGFLTKNRFVRESVLKDEFGPKRDIFVFARWFSQHKKALT